MLGAAGSAAGAGWVLTGVLGCQLPRAIAGPRGQGHQLAGELQSIKTNQETSRSSDALSDAFISSHCIT